MFLALIFLKKWYKAHFLNYFACCVI